MVNFVSQKISQVVNYRTLNPFGLLIEATNSNLNIHEFTPNQLRDLVWKNRLIILRGFPLLKRDDLSDYCRHWGELLSWDFGTVLDLVVHDNPQNYLFTTGNVPFHWDGAFARSVPSFLFFQCVKAPLPNYGGESLFCDTTRVWQKATFHQREIWKQIRIIYKTEKVSHYGGTIAKQLVSHHPLTNEIVLRFAEPLNEESVHLNPLFLEILGLPSEEHDQFLQDLKKMLYFPEHCYSHQWCEGDILIADNHALLHGRRSFLSGSNRHLQRVHIL